MEADFIGLSWVCFGGRVQAGGGGGGMLYHVRLFVTPWTVDRQDPLSMEFSRQESWSSLPFPTPGNLPHPGIEPVSFVSCIGKGILDHCPT